MITILIRYKGKNDNAKKYVEDMLRLGYVDLIRSEEGNLSYQCFFPACEDGSVLLVDSWINQEALDKHHKLPIMKKIIELREKYDLHMEVNKYQQIIDDKDKEFIRK